MITTPLESFMSAGQHDSNLYEENILNIWGIHLKGNQLKQVIGLYLRILRRVRGNFNPIFIQNLFHITYLKSPEQSQSSTSHVLLSLLPSGCNSDSSILEKE